MASDKKVNKKESGTPRKGSGWVRPDGKPLRKRKGDYFPDKEIEKRKPAHRLSKNSPVTGSHAGDKEKARPGNKSYRDNRDNSSYKSGDNEIHNSISGRQSHDKENSSRSSFSSRESGNQKNYRSRDSRKSDNKRNDAVRNNRQLQKGRKPFHTERSGEDKPVRLNKYIANAGICSRREADDLITAGVVSINGEIVSELGTKVYPGDVVKFHDRTLKTEKMVYILLNKPKDYITTTDDPEERKTVMNLVQNAAKERIFPVGRLDRNTTGLLLITNDGELTRRLTHPSNNIKKIYQVSLDRNLTQQDMLKAAAGVELEDGVQAVDEIHYESSEDKSVVGVELHSGKNRVVRRIFETLGYKVKKLDRVYFAGLTKKDLPRGRWRFLTEMEVNMLKMQTGRK